MAYLDFFVDVVVSGAVLGRGLGDCPALLVHVWGDDFTEAEEPRSLRRDYGLVEFSWTRPTASDDWDATGFTVHVHRLGVIDVSADLVARYGPFDARLRFADLQAELSRLGYMLAEITDDHEIGDGNVAENVRRYWLDESRVAISVVSTARQGQLDAGDVWSISAPYPAEVIVAADVGRHRHAVKDGLAHLLRLGEEDRQRWLDRHIRPATDPANHWLYWYLVVDGRLGDWPAEQPDWIKLRLWLLEQARVRRVFDVAACAEKVAYFVLAMRRAGVAGDLLPSADDIVRVCLDAIGADPNEVLLIDDPHDLVRHDIAELVLSNHAKTLVNAAQFHVDQVRDERLAERLREWISIRPRLV